MSAAPQTRESGFKTNPDYKVTFEPSPRRVRVIFNGETIADSTNARLLFENPAPAGVLFSTVGRAARSNDANRPPHFLSV